MKTLLRDDYGKNVCVSIPYHELSLIPEMDRLAHLRGKTRSEYLRLLVREDKQRAAETVAKRWSYVP